MKRLKIPKEVIRICKTKKNRQYNAQQKKVKRKKNYHHNTTQKTNSRVPETRFFLF